MADQLGGRSCSWVCTNQDHDVTPSASRTPHTRIPRRHFPDGAWSASGWPHVHLVSGSEGQLPSMGGNCLALTPGTVHAGLLTAGLDDVGTVAGRVRSGQGRRDSRHNRPSRLGPVEPRAPPTTGRLLPARQPRSGVCSSSLARAQVRAPLSHGNGRGMGWGHGSMHTATMLTNDANHANIVTMVASSCGGVGSRVR